MRPRTAYFTLVCALLGVGLLAGCAGADVTTTTAAGQTYAPTIDPAAFTSTIDNPYLPFLVGTSWVFEGTTEDGFEHIEVRVLPEKRTVMGVECVVVRDTVTLDGAVVEDTYDWYAQDADGNVWYFGEKVEDFENGTVVSTKGSWEAGVGGAQPGIVMMANPQPGDPYRQEYYAGEAEDMAQVLATGISEKVPFGSYADLVKTREWTPLDTSVAEEKYYAPNVGMVLEVIVEGGSGRVELIQMTTP